jgi:hypothetical protein
VSDGAVALNHQSTNEVNSELPGFVWTDMSHFQICLYVLLNGFFVTRKGAVTFTRINFDTLGTRCSFSGVKQPGRGADHSPPSNAEVKECVELYLDFCNTP